MTKYIENETFLDHVEIDSDTVVQFCTFHAGVTLRGDNILFRLNNINDSEFAITIFGQHNYVLFNRINGFYGDGIRILNSFNTVNDNRIEQSYLGNPENHNDGIQIWNHTDKYDVTDLTIKRNRLVLSESDVSTQGIIATDCSVSNSVIKGNLIDVSHWHGITLNESYSNEITWNVITNSLGDQAREPWIKLLTDDGTTQINNNIVSSVIPEELSPDNRAVKGDWDLSI